MAAQMMFLLFGPLVFVDGCWRLLTAREWDVVVVAEWWWLRWEEGGGGCGRGRCCWSLLLVVVGVMGVMSWQSVVTRLCALSSHPREWYVVQYKHLPTLTA